MKAVLLVSHGSRLAQTKKEVSSLVSRLRKQWKKGFIDYAFLEIESPSIPKGIEKCIKKGATQVVILLNFLNSGKHVEVDIPRIIKGTQKEYPQVKFKVTQPIGQHQGIVELFLDLIYEN